MSARRSQLSVEDQLIKICQAITSQDNINPAKRLSLILHTHKYPQRWQSFLTRLKQEFNSEIPIHLINPQTTITCIQMMSDKFK